MVEDKIESMKLSFNHYPRILNWKEQDRPVLAYQCNESTVRMDLTVEKYQIKGTKGIKKEYFWHVQGCIKDDYTFHKTFERFEDGYEYIEDMIKKYRLLLLF